MSVRRSLIVLTLLTAIAPMAAFSSRTTQMQAANPTQNLRVHTIERGHVIVTISAVGQIEADETANLSFTTQGRVTEKLVEIGDFVNAGDPLVRLDAAAQELAYQQAELAVQTAELNMQDLLDGPDEGDIRIAQANIDSAWAQYAAIADGVSDDDLRAAELRVQQAQDSYVAANEARRVAGGDDEDSIALMDAKIGEASFNIGIAEQQLQQLRSASGPDLAAAAARATQAEAELERLLAGATDAQIHNAEVAIEQAQTNLEQAAEELEKYTLTAPFDAVIGSIDVEIGTLARPGAPVVQLVDLEPMRLTVQVDEVDIRRIYEGLDASVEIDALQGIKLPAVLEQIALVGQADEGIINYDVDVALTENDPRVHVGMTAEAEVVVESRDNVLLVPNDYVRLERRQNQAFVNVLDDEGNLSEREIQLGLQGEQFSEVLSGLNEGDVIAVDLSEESFSFFGG
jgi:HlyD family secretion protein